MAAIPATRTPVGAPPTGGPPPVRYATQAAWPGITWGFDARCHSCPWAHHNGVYQVKYRYADCEVHRRG